MCRCAQQLVTTSENAAGSLSLRVFQRSWHCWEARPFERTALTVESPTRGFRAIFGLTGRSSDAPAVQPATAETAQSVIVRRVEQPGQWHRVWASSKKSLIGTPSPSRAHASMASIWTAVIAFHGIAQAAAVSPWFPDMGTLMTGRSGRGLRRWRPALVAQQISLSSSLRLSAACRASAAVFGMLQRTCR